MLTTVLANILNELYRHLIDRPNVNQLTQVFPLLASSPTQKKPVLSRCKPLVISLLLLAVYPLGYYWALHVYQDDPTTMNWNDREAFNKKVISQLTVDGLVSQTDVQRKLGGPDISEARQHNTHLLQLAYYRTDRALSDGLTTKDECTALLYQDRILVAIGAAAEQRYQQP